MRKIKMMGEIMTKNIKISGLEVKKDYDNSQKNMKLIYFIIILICYIPAYITFFPLLFNYDAPMQTYASAEKNSPLLHTFFLKTFYILGIKVFKSATIYYFSSNSNDFYFL